jgi:hypothetical protein
MRDRARPGVIGVHRRRVVLGSGVEHLGVRYGRIFDGLGSIFDLRRGVLAFGVRSRVLAPRMRLTRASFATTHQQR